MTRRDALHALCLAVPVVLRLSPAAAADAAGQPPNGSYLGSRLLPAEPQGACPPDTDPVYQAYEIVTGTDMRQRPWGFAQTLREVLVKSSGDPRLRSDPRIADLAAHADRLVACFGYADMMAQTPLHDDQGTYDRPYRLTVTFDPAKIDAALAALGDKPWRGERPAVVPLLRVRGRKPPAYLLSAETPAGVEQRGAFAVAAGQFGLKYRIPSGSEFARWGVSIDRLPPVPPPSTANDAVVLGTLEWREALPGWVGEWRLRWAGRDHQWGVSGVNYDAAFRDIVSGVALIASGNGVPGGAEH